jgi:hypothetical protein
MKYSITITQVEARTWVIDADDEAQAIAMAEIWNEERTGDCPAGCLKYTYTFDSETEVEGG